MSTNMQTLAQLLYPVRHRCFISYHHADKDEVRRFTDTFSQSWEGLYVQALGLRGDADLINSWDNDYVLRMIRERYMQNTSVTIVMLGRCTWSRKFVDWEIAASLRNMPLAPANGLLAVRLPSFPEGAPFPPRLNDNLFDQNETPRPNDYYARVIPYPTSVEELRKAIEEAYQRRQSHRDLIRNSAERFKKDRPCD